jgi:hypothetical protein
MELGPTSVQCLYFLAHPAVYALLPFLRIPSRIPRTDPLYLVALLNRAQLAFVSDYLSLIQVLLTIILGLLLYCS